MEAATDLLRLAGSAALGLLLSPFYYIGVLLIMLQYFRQTRLERKLFHVRLHAWPNQLARTMLAGLVVGVLITLIGLFLGVTVNGEAVLWLWGAAVVLLLVRVRYLCFAYSAGMLGLLQWGLGWSSLDGRGDWIGTAVRSIGGLDIPGLLVLVALMHIAEGLLVRWQGARFASPLFLEGKRGKLVGGYMLQGYWPVPMLLLVPAAAGGGGVDLPWSLLLGGGSAWSHGVTMIGFPMMIGFTELTRTMLPGAKARSASKALLLYGLAVGVVAVAASYWSPLMLAAALCALLFHEALVAVSYYKEDANTSLYVHDGRGLRILAVIPGTPAEAMGLQAGEIIQKVNGALVRSKEELHAALHINSAFCKLEAINLEGHVKFVQRARYAGEHHQLGVVLSPDDQAGFYAAASPASLFDLLRKRTAKSRSRSTSASSSL
ncbi:PDZ domain-containing protein [Paenibacillus rhizovicinus]|uniref:PDZ domain-containing protein n=1 Tax=Paenibacillus rhizovicinus TaxID=2704463 RepID=A0A6C0P2D1_9BACL|nr:PDZ domain-containing protein [Paenibacillus rhizovicinus]QHW32629.1 PDZ domain-containing protein [Paenibacillus rhizovicinus]